MAGKRPPGRRAGARQGRPGGAPWTRPTPGVRAARRSRRGTRRRPCSTSRGLRATSRGAGSSASRRPRPGRAEADRRGGRTAGSSPGVAPDPRTRWPRPMSASRAATSSARGSGSGPGRGSRRPGTGERMRPPRRGARHRAVLLRPPVEGGIRRRPRLRPPHGRSARAGSASPPGRGVARPTPPSTAGTPRRPESSIGGRSRARRTTAPCARSTSGWPTSRSWTVISAKSAACGALLWRPRRVTPPSAPQSERAREGSRRPRRRPVVGRPSGG